MIKLIVSDLDGTLLDSKKTVPQCHIDAIKEALDNGKIVTFFTGRSRHSANSVVGHINLDVPMVFQNGALITHGFSMNIIRALPLRGDVARRAYELAKDMGIFYVLYTDFFDEKDMVMEEPYSGVELRDYFDASSWRHRYGDVLAYIKDNVAQIALVGEEEKIRELIEILYTEFGDKSFSPVKTRAEKHESFWELFGYGTGKEEALKFLMKYFDVTSNEVLFMGDGYNDIGIMQLVGYPVAMANAPDDVKKHARYIAPSNDECGVAWAINNIALK